MPDLDIRHFLAAEAIHLFVLFGLPSSREGQGHLQEILVPCELTACGGPCVPLATRQMSSAPTHNAI